MNKQNLAIKRNDFNFIFGAIFIVYSIISFVFICFNSAIGKHFIWWFLGYLVIFFVFFILFIWIKSQSNEKDYKYVK